MTKYKWSLLGLIISIILFLLLLINPLISFKNSIKFIPKEPIPETTATELTNANFIVYSEKLAKVDVEDREKFKEMFNKDKEKANNDYKEWLISVPKKFVWSSLNVIFKSFYHWNLFWIPIIVFSFMTFNYKKINK